MKNKYLPILLLLLSVSNSSAVALAKNALTLQRHKDKDICHGRGSVMPGHVYPYCVSENEIIKGSCNQKEGTTHIDGYCCSIHYPNSDGSSKTDIRVYPNPEWGNQSLYGKASQPPQFSSC